MPYAPHNTVCREFGCQNTKAYKSAYCTSHGGGASKTKRANSKLYNQVAWAKIRERQLSKHPLCARCQSMGKITAGQHIDHLFPHRRDGGKFVKNIFQTLCAECHTQKTKDERKGLYNHYTPHGVKIYTDLDYNAMLAATLR